MQRQLRFCRIHTNLKGLMHRAQEEWERYMDGDPNHYQWVCIEKPDTMARALEILSSDLPEEDLAMLVTRMPYLILLFQDSQTPKNVPVEAMVAFLSVLNQAGLATLMRQSSDTHRLANLVGCDGSQWKPLLFLVAGVPDLDDPLQAPTHDRWIFV